MKEALNLQLTFDESHVAELAAALQGRLRPDQWKLLAALAAEIVARWERVATGSLVVVVSADQQVAEVAKALGAPGLDRAAAKLAAAR